MHLGVLLPILPFVLLLFTRLWLSAVLSAAAGLAAGWFVLHLPDAEAARDWWWWVVLGYATVVSLAMAIAETVVAAIVLRGRFFRGLLSAVSAHAAWLAWLFLGPGEVKGQTLLLVLTAMVGAAGATVGAARSRG